MCKSYHVDKRRAFQAEEMCRSMEMGLIWCCWRMAVQYAQSIWWPPGDVGEGVDGLEEGRQASRQGMGVEFVLQEEIISKPPGLSTYWLFGFRQIVLYLSFFLL